MPVYQTIAQMQGDLTAKKISARDLVEEHIQAIERHEPGIHAFIEVLAEDARAQAKMSDARRQAGNAKGPLEGIPIAIKDNISTVEGHTRAASKILEHFKSPYDATAVRKLKEAGAIVIGKTNLDEFGMGASTEYSAYGLTRNPWDTTRVTGGTSGGSTAAVASGEVVAALGTDTGGSSRHPASFCGVVGLRPTYGRASRFGAVAYGSSLDQISPITRTVADAALLLSVMAGKDIYDATTSPGKVPAYHEKLGGDIKGLTIGIPDEFFGLGIDEAVAAKVREALATLEEAGAKLKRISLPLTKVGIPVYYLIAKAEGSTNLARYDGLRFSGKKRKMRDLLETYLETRGQDLGPEVKRTILMGTYALSAGYADAWYKQASRVRTLIRREYEAAFKEVDIIAGPTTVETAFKIGSKTSDPLQMYLTDALVVLMPLAGVPVISVPCGFIDNLPIGLQLTAAHWQEEKLLHVAHVYEQAHDWWKRVPSNA